MTLAYIYYRFRGLNMVQGILAGLRPAVIAMIASAGISLLIMALYGQRTLPNDLASLDRATHFLFLPRQAEIHFYKGLLPLSYIS